MGCFAKIKPMRTSAKDSQTGCCTIVKVLAFYVFGCTACRKARKKVPKDIRRRFAGAWKHEVALGTDVPLTPVHSEEPPPRLATTHDSDGMVDRDIWDEKIQQSLPRTSRPPRVVKAEPKATFKGHTESVKNSIRRNHMRDSPHPNAHSATLISSTPDQREWMFQAPESANHMRAIRSHGHTWFTKEGEAGSRERVPRNRTARAARDEAERREKESNGREKWDIRERVVITDDGYFIGTNLWEPFYMGELKPLAEDQTDPEKASNDHVIGGTSKRGSVGGSKAKSRSPSPPPAPLPVWPVAGVSSGTLMTLSSSPKSTPRSTPTGDRRASEDTTETGSTELTVPDDSPWLKVAMESPLPVTPMTQSPNLSPKLENVTVTDYFPISKLGSAEPPVSKMVVSDPQTPDPFTLDSLVLESPVTDSSAMSLTMMEILQNNKYAYKPHLAWEQWRAQRRNALLAGGEQQVVLADLGERGPAYLPSTTLNAKRSPSISWDWRPWPQTEKKPKVHQADLTLKPSEEAEVVEIVAGEERVVFKLPKNVPELQIEEKIASQNPEIPAKEKIVFGFSKKRKERKRKGKGKAKEIDGWEISPLGGYVRYRDACLEDDDSGQEGGVYGNLPRARDSQTSLITVMSVAEILSKTDGGISGSCGKGTEEYERQKNGQVAWEAEEWDRKKKVMQVVIEEGRKYARGTKEYEYDGARMFEKIVKTGKEGPGWQARWSW